MIIKADQNSPENITEYYQLLDWAKLISKDYVNLERIIIKDKDDNIIIFAQVYIYKLISRYTQLYIPRGPIIYSDNISQEQIQEFWDNIQELSQKHNAIFSLFEPPEDIFNSYAKVFNRYTEKSIIERLPHQTQILDLTLSEEDLLKNMHSKMRYNIRLAQKKGVAIKTISDNDTEFNKYFDIFFDLMQETSQRSKFAVHPKTHYKHLLKHNSPELKVSLMTAEYEGKILATNIILDTLYQRIYLHGASSNQNRNLMAPPLLQWHSILEAKKLGKKIYDFWGVSKTKKSWQGISRFKIQFGGKTISYPDSQIYIHQKFIFNLYKIFRQLRGKSI
jgi:lipid II:glycine glycyltransferase (peptidoglycan interpeptide bridge formation enzyme)